MRRKKAFVAVLIALLLLCLVPLTAFASPSPSPGPGASPSVEPSPDPGASDPPEGEGDAGTPGGASGALLKVANSIIETWEILLASANALLQTTPADWSPAGWSLAQQIHGPDGMDVYGSGIKPIAIGIMICLWAISFFRHLDGLHKIDVREVMGWILRFMLIYAIIEVSFGLMETVLQICMDINAKIMAVTDEARSDMAIPSELQDAYTAFGEAMDDGSIFDKIGLFFSMLLPLLALAAVWVIVLACGLVVVVTLALRFFKMYIYAAIAPIPLSTFAGSETQDIGKHFLKNWFAVCLEVCIIAIAIGVFTASLADSGALFPALQEAAASAGAFFDPDDIELFRPTVLWGVNVAVKATLLAAIVRGSDQISQKIVGAG